jgi:hypothetical protein
MWQRKKARAKAEEITGVKIANERCACGPDSSVKPLFRHRDTIFKNDSTKKIAPDRAKQYGVFLCYYNGFDKIQSDGDIVYELV